ncbi:inositol phosphatidylinositol phosphatase, partial [Strigomonas culicis]
MFPGLPRVFPNAEWSRVEDVFRFYGSMRATAVQCRNLPPAEMWVQQELQYYEASFCRTEELTVNVTTFNVGCKKPHLPMNELAAVQFPSHLGELAGKPVDVIVLAFQEVDMSASAMFKEETDASQPWIQGACAAVGADSNPSSSKPYYALPPKQLVGLLLCVFVRRPLAPAIKEYVITTVATGALGSLGNKGAVGVHLSIHCTDLCIITAHLAAGQSNVSKRNEDINSILKNMDFNASRRAEVQATANAGIVPEMLYPELF